MKRYYMIAEGRVQGVGFRSFCIQLALEYDLTGSVRNMDNGMVEIFAQGEEDNLRQFISRLREGTRWIRIDNLSIKETAVIPGEKKFRYEFYSSPY